MVSGNSGLELCSNKNHAEKKVWTILDYVKRTNER